MNDIGKYLKSCKVGNNRYSTIKACIIASKLFMQATYDKDSSIWMFGKRKIVFVESGIKPIEKVSIKKD
jgi:hypothetical protein